MGQHTLLGAVILAVTAFSASASTLFSTFPDAKYPEDKLVHFTPFNVITAIDGSNISVLPVSGKLTKHSFELPDSYTLELVINNITISSNLTNSMLRYCFNASRRLVVIHMF